MKCLLIVCIFLVAVTWSLAEEVEASEQEKVQPLAVADQTDSDSEDQQTAEQYYGRYRGYGYRPNYGYGRGYGYGGYRPYYGGYGYRPNYGGYYGGGYRPYYGRYRPYYGGYRGYY